MHELITLLLTHIEDKPACWNLVGYYTNLTQEKFSFILFTIPIVYHPKLMTQQTSLAQAMVGSGVYTSLIKMPKSLRLNVLANDEKKLTFENLPY